MVCGHGFAWVVGGSTDPCIGFYYNEISICCWGKKNPERVNFIIYFFTFIICKFISSTSNVLVGPPLLFQRIKRLVWQRIFFLTSEFSAEAHL